MKSVSKDMDNRTSSEENKGENSREWGREKTTTEDEICFRDHLSQWFDAADENRQLPII